jgi:ectoine hydroxylase-related dioxygenase (phytanoyl-CoA dioxygenase family)
MKSYGINISSSSNPNLNLHIEEFNNLGYTIIEDVLKKDEIIELRLELDRVYKIQEYEFGADALKRINENNLVRIPLFHSELFVRLSSRPDMLNYVEQILGKYFILHLQNGIINMPKEEHHQSSWHKDLPYQNWIASEPLACNIYYCLDDFSSETGGTWVLPFSHYFNSVPSNQYIEKNSVQLTARAGSVILFNSMLLHKAGFNISENYIRRGVNHVYSKPIITQQIDLPAFLGGKYSNDEILSILFGYKTMSAKSVEEYRKSRILRHDALEKS